MELSQRSIAAIRELSEGTATTLANIASDFSTTMTAIKTAITSAVIGNADAVALWKAARRRRLVAERDAELVNLPCSYVEPAAGGGAEAAALPGIARVGHRVERRFETGGLLLGDDSRHSCGFLATAATILVVSADILRAERPEGFTVAHLKAGLLGLHVWHCKCEVLFVANAWDSSACTVCRVAAHWALTGTEKSQRTL